MKHQAWLALLLTFTALLSTFGIAHAQSDLYWERYDVDIEVRPDGALRVTETQTIVFVDGSFHVGFAAIPLDRLDAITDVAVSEGGQAYTRVSSGERAGTFQTFVDGDEFIIEWYFPYTSNAARTFTLAYTVEGGLRYYPSETPPIDVLQWVAIAPDHDARIDQARVTVRYPENARLFRDSVLPSGYAADAAGGDATTRVDVERNIITVETTRPLRPNEPLEIGVKFEHGAIAGSPPAWQAAYDRAESEGPLVAFGSIVATIGIVLLGSLGLFLLWYVRGRDPEVGLPADYLSEPPSDAPPGLVGVLIDERADMKDIIATVVDLARRGAMTMEEVRTEGAFGIGSSRDFIFRPKPDFDVNSLRPYERRVLSSLVGSGETRLSSLKNKFYAQIPHIEKQLYEAAVAEGFFPASPEGVRARYVGLGLLLIVVAVAAVFFLVPRFADVSGAICLPVVALGLLALLVMGAARAMPARTRKGAEEAAKWRAFQKYLQDLPRFQKVEEASTLFDQFLPYAIAFGVERRWMSLFEQVQAGAAEAPVPTWYTPWGWGTRGSRGVLRGGGVSEEDLPGGERSRSTGGAGGWAGGFQDINKGLTSLFNQAGQVFRSVPGSGSRGGFSGGYRGGGFRMGGGGGGGRRGFR